MRIDGLIISAAIFLVSLVPSHAETTVKVGVLNDRSGVYADIGGEGSVVAAKMAIEDLELPRPLLKYARQASLVEQPTLPGLGLQYCCSSCA